MPILSVASLNPQINGLTVAGANSVVQQIRLPKNAPASIQTKDVGTAATGTWKFELGNDLVDWNDATNSFAAAVNQPTALTGTQTNFLLLPETFAGFSYLQVTFTSSAGTHVLTMSVRQGDTSL
jgi:hypothetical protein